MEIQMEGHLVIARLKAGVLYTYPRNAAKCGVQISKKNLLDPDNIERQMDLLYGKYACCSDKRGIHFFARPKTPG